MHPKFFLTLAIALISCSHGYTQKTTDGPVIHGDGAVYAVENPDFSTSVNGPLWAVIDVAASAKKTGDINPYLNTAARYLNMHAQQGVPVKNLKVALVVHGNAVEDILQSSFYKKRKGIDNPNEMLVQKLIDSGVRIVLCGQSATAHKIPFEGKIQGVQTALSAMTALVQLQNDGYRLIKF